MALSCRIVATAADLWAKQPPLPRHSASAGVPVRDCEVNCYSLQSMNIQVNTGYRIQHPYSHMVGQNVVCLFLVF